MGGPAGPSSAQNEGRSLIVLVFLQGIDLDEKNQLPSLTVLMGQINNFFLFNLWRLKSLSKTLLFAA
jgi:hypothetical protein